MAMDSRVGIQHKWIPPVRRNVPDFDASTLRASTGAILAPWPRLNAPHNVHFFDYAAYYTMVESREDQAELTPVYLWPGQPTPSMLECIPIMVKKSPEVRVAWETPREIGLDLPGECGGGFAFMDTKHVHEASFLHALQIPMLKIERVLCAVAGQTLLDWNAGTAGGPRPPDSSPGGLRMIVQRVTKEGGEAAGTLRGSRMMTFPVMHMILIRIGTTDILIDARLPCHPRHRPTIVIKGPSTILSEFLPWFLHYVFLPAMNFGRENLVLWNYSPNLFRELAELARNGHVLSVFEQCTHGIPVEQCYARTGRDAWCRGGQPRLGDEFHWAPAPTEVTRQRQEDAQFLQTNTVPEPDPALLALPPPAAPVFHRINNPAWDVNDPSLVRYKVRQDYDHQADQARCPEVQFMDIFVNEWVALIPNAPQPPEGLKVSQRWLWVRSLDGHNGYVPRRLLEPVDPLPDLPTGYAFAIEELRKYVAERRLDIDIPERQTWMDAASARAVRVYVDPNGYVAERAADEEQEDTPALLELRSAHHKFLTPKLTRLMRFWDLLPGMTWLPVKPDLTWRSMPGMIIRCQTLPYECTGYDQSWLEMKDDWFAGQAWMGFPTFVVCAPTDPESGFVLRALEEPQQRAECRTRTYEYQQEAESASLESPYRGPTKCGCILCEYNELKEQPAIVGYKVRYYRFFALVQQDNHAIIKLSEAEIDRREYNGIRSRSGAPRSHSPAPLVDTRVRDGRRERSATSVTSDPLEAQPTSIVHRPASPRTPRRGAPWRDTAAVEADGVGLHQDELQLLSQEEGNEITAEQLREHADSHQFRPTDAPARVRFLTGEYERTEQDVILGHWRAYCNREAPEAPRELELAEQLIRQQNNLPPTARSLRPGERPCDHHPVQNIARQQVANALAERPGGTTAENRVTTRTNQRGRQNVPTAVPDELKFYLQRMYQIPENQLGQGHTWTSLRRRFPQWFSPKRGNRLCIPHNSKDRAWKPCGVDDWVPHKKGLLDEDGEPIMVWFECRMAHLCSFCQCPNRIGRDTYGREEFWQCADWYGTCCKNRVECGGALHCWNDGTPAHRDRKARYDS